MEIEKFKIEGLEFIPSTIINCSSLIQLLSILVKKCNDLDSKYIILDSGIANKEKRLSNLETLLNINGVNPNYVYNSPTRKMKEKEETEFIENSTLKEEKENPQNVDNKENREKIELNYTMFSELYKKVKDNGKFIKSIISTLNTYKKSNEETNNEYKNNIEAINSTIINETKKLQSLTEKVEKKISIYDEDIDNLKVKLKDFNLYDLFKYQNLSPEIDTDFMKNIITGLESKMNKKFVLNDDKIKLINYDIFKLKEEVRNNNSMISGYGMSFEKINKAKEELNQKYTNLSNILGESIKDIKNKISIFETKVKLLGHIPNIPSDEKFIDLKNEESEFRDLFSQNISNNSNEKIIVEETKDDKSNLIKKVRIRLYNLEKFCKNNFNEINIKEINSKIISLEKNSKNYLLYEEELNHMNDKIRNADTKMNEFNKILEANYQDIEQLKLEINHTIKKVDTINYDISKIASREVNKNTKDSNSNIIDPTKFISSKVFNENTKENNLKFEKMQKKYEELENNIDSILDKLVHTPNDDDFAKFQDIIKNMIENIVIKNKKQFANKFETVKSYKLLETKLNTINDTYNKKINGSDNWLLAKKPLNSYQCASCESIIKGELEQKGDYIYWNKYPYRDENKSTYRMGHGFSHMLHLINEGLLKDTGEPIKDEDKKKGKKEEKLLFEKNKKNSFEELSLDMLPKLKKKSNIYNLSLGIDSPVPNPNEPKAFNNTIDNFDKTPQIIKILKKNRSSVFKTSGNNIHNEKSRNRESIKFINFSVDDKKTE